MKKAEETKDPSAEGIDNDKGPAYLNMRLRRVERVDAWLGER